MSSRIARLAIRVILCFFSAPYSRLIMLIIPHLITALGLDINDASQPINACHVAHMCASML